MSRLSHINWRDDLHNLRGAMRRFGHAVLANHQLLALMLLAVTAMAGIEVAYYADARLRHGPWNTYEDGLFSVSEAPTDSFTRIALDQELSTRIQRRLSGRLLCAYQKVIENDNGDFQYLHIDVVSLDSLLGHAYASETRTYARYLRQRVGLAPDFEFRQLGNINGHPALAYKSRERDGSGYYAMGMLVCAHHRAYTFENYTFHSPYSDWRNDVRTYFWPCDALQGFSVDDMGHVEARFFVLTLALFALFLLSMWLIFRIAARGGVHCPPAPPVTRPATLQRFQLMLALTVICVFIMALMVITFWQFMGPRPFTSAIFIAWGLMLLCINLPALIHLYRKSRSATPGTVAGS